MDELYTNYKAAILGSGVDGATEEFVAKVMASVCERVMIELNPKATFTFPSQHQRILEPYNYYNFGQRYIRGLVDFKKSMLGHSETFAQISKQLAAGENVVLLANHQTEADPAVFALLLEAEFPNLATDVYYVAGDRVVTDALCKPFSMGRNLFCVHSKKHLDDIPELKAEKQATNRRTLKAMQSALNEGGKLLWIAPSGGRDRSIDEATGETQPDSFDPSAVELMRALTAKAKPAGHLYPFAMYSYRYDFNFKFGVLLCRRIIVMWLIILKRFVFSQSRRIMPPPRVVEKSIGEKREVFHAPVGISVGAELDTEAIVAGIGRFFLISMLTFFNLLCFSRTISHPSFSTDADDKEARVAALAQEAFSKTAAEYTALLNAINNPDQAAATGFSQPWLKYPQPALDQWK